MKYNLLSNPGQTALDQQRRGAGSYACSLTTPVNKECTMTREEFEGEIDLILDSETGDECSTQVNALLACYDEQRALIEQQEKQISELREHRDHFLRYAAEWRGLDADHVCPKCKGAGTTAYANTSTYHHGAGGQAITIGVCDGCWGSGDRYRPWTSWLVIEQQAKEIERLTMDHAEINAEFDRLNSVVTQQMEEIEWLKAQLTESEKAAYDVAGTIEQLQAQLATAKREVWDAVILKLRTGGLNILGLWEWCRQQKEQL